MLIGDADALCVLRQASVSDVRGSERTKHKRTPISNTSPYHWGKSYHVEPESECVHVKYWNLANMGAYLPQNVIA